MAKDQKMKIATTVPIELIRIAVVGWYLSLKTPMKMAPTTVAALMREMARVPSVDDSPTERAYAMWSQYIDVRQIKVAMSTTYRGDKICNGRNLQDK